MAKINGTLTARVEIEATDKELLEALAKELGFFGVVVSDHDSYSKLIAADPEKKTAAKLLRLEDKSYHGSPSYQVVSERELSEAEYECAKALQTIKQYVKEKARNR